MRSAKHSLLKELRDYSWKAIKLSVPINSVGVIATYFEVSSWLPKWLAVLLSGVIVTTRSVFVLAILSFGFSLVLLLISLLFRRETRQAAILFALSASYLLIAFPGLMVSQSIYRWGFVNVALRGAPLVTAIHAYEAKYGHPPIALSELVPEFLDKIPETGMSVSPEYEYQSGQAAAAYDENPWILSVRPPFRGVGFDQFFYFPRQNYPKDGYGGWLEPIRDWAYVHE